MNSISRTTLGLAAALALALLTSSCTTPIVEAGGSATVELERFPAGTSTVVTETADGQLLNGLHVSAGPDAPLVLHLLPRGASTTSGLPPFGGFPETLTALRELGFSSLAIDYRGVGASLGPVDSSALPTDAQTIWQAALEHVGGDANRIVLRGASLGTLAIAAILEGGATPRAIVMAAPVDADSVTTNALRSRYGALLGGFLDVFFLEPDVAHLPATLAGVTCPTLVLLPGEDPYLTSEETEAISRAAESSALVTVERMATEHEPTVLRFYSFELSAERGAVVTELLPAEAAFLRALLTVP